MDFLVFLEEDSSRAKYIFHHILHKILGLDVKFTNDQNSFINSNQPKVNYSKKRISNELFFYASEFMFSKKIESQNLIFSTFKDTKIFFLCEKSSLPFDLFAASFYLLSRYEEYLPYKKDKIGRFDVKDSLGFKNNFLTQPIVDKWILFLKEILIQKFPNISFEEKKFRFINTIDVDNAYAYLEKGFFRSSASLFKDLIKLKFGLIKERIDVLFYNKKDPYDSYNKLLAIHNKYHLKTIFFFLLGDYGYYDRNIHYSNIKLAQQIQHISKYCNVGIHSSMQSIYNRNKTFKEIQRLESIIRKKVSISRQHYIFLNMPYNYRNLIDCGIEDDYSMGYPTHPGFRAGTSFPFYFFDLQKNIVTNLLVHPFCVMDVSFNNYLNLEPDDSLELIKNIIKRVKKVNGQFISVWHNESLHNMRNWKNWGSLYEDMIKYIIDEKN